MSLDQPLMPPPDDPNFTNGTQEPEARTWNMLCHLSALSGLFTGIGFWLGPLIVWLVQKDRFKSVDAHGKEAVNFAISMFLYELAATLGGIVIGVLTCGIGMFLGVALLSVLGIAHLVLIVIASIQANAGGFYRYPYIWRPIQ
jgi:uncharacterized Tic20 family protein